MLLKLSLPATFAMVVNGLYNLVDTFFIGRRVGTNGIGGLALAFPVQMIVMAVGLAVGQGTASVVSRNLGANNEEKARRAAGVAVAMSLTFGLVIFIAGKIFLEPLLNILGATEALHEYARSYLNVILFGFPVMTITMTFNNLLRSEGMAKQSMTVMLIGALTNIVLDPLFIFVFNMGVAGAAWATVIGQAFSLLYAAYFYLMKKTHVTIGLKDLIPEVSVMKEIFGLGLPSFVRQAGQSIVAMMINNLLGRYGGDLYISAYGIVYRIVMFCFMPMFGLVQGFQPLAGYNYGAKLYGRVRRTLKVTISAASVYSAAGFLMMFLFPGLLARIFTTDGALIDTSEYVMRHIVLMFALLGMQVVGGQYFQSTGKPFPSLILNLSRQFIFLIPLLLFMPGLFGIKGILLCFPIADVLSVALTMTWLLADLRRLPKKDG